MMLAAARALTIQGFLATRPNALHSHVKHERACVSGNDTVVALLASLGYASPRRRSVFANVCRQDL